MRLTQIGIIGILVFCTADFPFRGQVPLNLPSYKGKATLKIENSKIRLGDTSTVEFTFYNNGGGDWFYNCFFNRLIPLPGQLAIYSSEKKYLGDLITWEGGSQKKISVNDWTLINGDSHAGTQIRFTAKNLPEGKYYLQLIFYQAFISPNPFRTVGEKINFYKTFDCNELFRSNAIEVELVDK